MNLPNFDSSLFHEGKAFEVYQQMGAHQTVQNGLVGVRFVLWAPNAQSIHLVCGSNGWNETATPMEKSEDGIWTAFITGLNPGEAYRYVVVGADGIKRYKADPYAFYNETRPGTASLLWPLDGYTWKDSSYMDNRPNLDESLNLPMAIYEVHLGSWKRNWYSGGDGFLNYRQLADELSEYVTYMHFTHVELIGICEYPLDASWGYQVTGYYSPTGRYGTPDDFRYFVDKMHQCNIGVILDWVPAHFPKDDFALARFDGTPMYEYADSLRMEYPQWGTLAFDHGKGEVKSFLISNAMYWVKEFHIDALRVDAVAAMLYNSFGRSEWRPNVYGGTENLESFAFFKELNSTLRKNTQAYLIAEDSSVLPGITKPVEEDGFGFGYKWNMGWMHDTLEYVEKDPLYRGWHHDWLTHSSDYAFLENFVLVLSHDEVVHLKHSMLNKFPGNKQDQFGGLKTLYTYMITHPGKKLLFMGQEFAQEQEWDENREISWGLAEEPSHRDVMETFRRLLDIYRKYPALYTDSPNPTTFEWVNRSDAMRSTISFIRRNPWNYEGALLVICNFAPVQYDGYTCGAPEPGSLHRIFSTYDDGYDNSEILTTPGDCDGYAQYIEYNLRPYESVIFAL